MDNTNTKIDLNKAISHCKSVISEMPDCDCKEEHKQLLYFLQELQFRQELDEELPWEIQEIIKKFKLEYFYNNYNKHVFKQNDFITFNDLLHDEHRVLNTPRQMFALKCLMFTLMSALGILTLIGIIYYV